MTKKTILIIILFSIFLIPPSAFAVWIEFINCEDLANGIFTPQRVFTDPEPVCFFGGNFSGEPTTILLKDEETRKVRFLTVSTVKGKVSSAEGYYFTNFEAGTYHYPDECNNVMGCRNQDGEYACKPTDTTCQLIRFHGTDENCTEDTTFVEADSDEDGWTDSCDNFPHDWYEQKDIDLDGVGYNNEFDDFDKHMKMLKYPDRGKKPKKNDTKKEDENDTSTENPEPTDDSDGGYRGDIPNPYPLPRQDNTDSETPQENNGADNSGSQSGSGGGGGSNPIFKSKDCTPEYECDFWSECINGKQHRECTIINSCTTENNPPELEQDCGIAIQPTIKTTEENTNTNNSVETTQEPTSTESPTGFSAITGFATRSIEAAGKSSPVFIGVLIIIGSAFVLTFVKRKKSH